MIRRLSILFFAISCAGLISLSSQNLQAEPTAREVVNQMDQKTRGNTSQGLMELQIDRDRVHRSLLMQIWDESSTDRGFIRVLKPERDRGTAFLKVKNNMWQYVPSINKEIKIEGSLLQDSWMGSDFTNDDLLRATSVVDDYTHKFLSTSGEEYTIEMIPKPSAAVVWSRIVLKVRKSDYLPVEQQFFDHKGRLKKKMLYDKIQPMGGRTIPTRYQMISLENGREVSRTTLIFHQLQFNTGIPAHVFSKSNLRK
ncbi:MAG TPA: outer membrane lipoprotein-sorting protein [Leptospiraceae bacterium]|nr:outer membrane lipoprotein-sorting protein [Spirochaetaceae bacterium]HBS06039.1 outer membrane lipoprotein-sorting protein [Leptospiraceae bacterium]